VLWREQLLAAGRCWDGLGGELASRKRDVAFRAAA
jgi:hypothetical protein